MFPMDEEKMKAVGYFEPELLATPKCLIDIDVDMPVAESMDLLVEVKAVSVNPVDYKIRASRRAEQEIPVILGWDAAGVIMDIGEKVQGFKKGDLVYYAGDLMRPGSNAQYQAVDHRLVAKMPKSLSFADAAALPLTSLTAYEGLFSKLKVPMDKEFNILIIGGAGGVSSLVLQLVKALTKGRVFVTYGRQSTKEWLEELGADGLINRQQTLLEGMQKLNLPYFDSIFSTTHTKEYFSEFYRILRPFGDVCLIDDPDILDIVSLKNKSATISWEAMFAKSLHKYDMESQGEILTTIADLVDSGKIRSTTTTVLNGLTASNFIKAHSILESGTSTGKIVVVY